MRSDPDTPAAGADWLVVCLCAAWCGTCRDWRASFEQAGAEHPQARFLWVDIEDEADTLGEVDVETFPTLLVAQGREPRFFGPVLPQPGQLARLLKSLREDPRSGLPLAPEATGLLAAIDAHLLSKP